MDTIDLDAIIEDKIWKIRRRLQAGQTDDLKDAIKEAIHQALVLASQKAKVKDIAGGLFGGGDLQVDKQSILDVYLLIK